MKETSKSLHLIPSMKGKGIDIGCGDDPLPMSDIDCWDKNRGDAMLMHSIDDNVYDFIYSSHCLEHLVNIETTLSNWKRILKPSGFMYIVVPDYLYYEKLTWPSMYNKDHKHSFSQHIHRNMVHRPNHWHIKHDLFPLINKVGLKLIRDELQIVDFDFNQGTKDQTLEKAICQIALTITYAD